MMVEVSAMSKSYGVGAASKLVAVVLSTCLVLTGCQAAEKSDSDTAGSEEATQAKLVVSASGELLEDVTASGKASDLQAEIWDAVQAELPEGCTVEDVQVSYVSKEYIEELEFNSQSTLYFGKTLDELDAEFDGERYVFTCEDGQTTVEPFEADDDSQEQMKRKVLAGLGVAAVAGVILLAVKVATPTGIATTGISVAAKSLKISPAAVRAVAQNSVKVLNVASGVSTVAGVVCNSDFNWSAFSGTQIRL
jgi:hypothetical protein